jgi:hypothetical protein
LGRRVPVRHRKQERDGDEQRDGGGANLSRFQHLTILPTADLFCPVVPATALLGLQHDQMLPPRDPKGFHPAVLRAPCCR